MCKLRVVSCLYLSYFMDFLWLLSLDLNVVGVKPMCVSSEFSDYRNDLKVVGLKYCFDSPLLLKELIFVGSGIEEVSFVRLSFITGFSFLLCLDLSGMFLLVWCPGLILVVYPKFRVKITQAKKQRTMIHICSCFLFRNSCQSPGPCFRSCT